MIDMVDISILVFSVLIIALLVFLISIVQRPKKYIYEVVSTGQYPTFNKDIREEFLNPVLVGDKIKKDVFGSELLLVESIHHYNNISVIYTSHKQEPKND